jgi:hypothetical protein
MSIQNHQIAIKLLVTAIAMVFGGRIASAQCGDPPVNYSNVRQWAAACRAYGGHVSNGQCVGWDTNWCNHGSQPTDNSNSGPSAEELERQRAEQLQRQQEQERIRQEAERLRAQREFEDEVRKLSGELKGVSNNDSGLKGVDGGNTAFFGLKGVSPTDASTMIKTAPADRSSRDVSTASKRLTCATDITNSALKHVTKIVSGTGSQADLDEIKYLAGEGTNALQGNALGVQCNSNASLTFTRALDLPHIAAAYKTAMDRVVKDSGTLYQLQQQAESVQQNVDEAKKQVDELKSQKTVQAQRPPASQTPPNPAKSTGDPVVDKAYAQQKAWQQQDQEKINQVIAEQKKLQQEKPACPPCALLKKVQAEQNAFNSQKVNATRALTDDVKKTEDIVAGNVPQE